MSRRAIASGDELQFVVFRLGTRELAFSIGQVERILRYTPPEPWPDAPEFVAGMIPFGGGQAPVVDLRGRAGSAPVFHEETRIIVLSIAPAQLAVVVDQVTEVVRVDARTILPPVGEIPGIPAKSAGGLIERAQRTITILNAARLLTGAEQAALSEAWT
jgi:purine-binding chemotaxis protein CheW